jgi:hypothetical protein
MVKTDCGKRQRPYSKPTLTIYGKVQELTKVVSTRGQPDGGTSGSGRNFTSA